FPQIVVNVPYDFWKVSLNYDAQTVNFTVGSILTGGTSGAKARIVKDTDAGSTGTLQLAMHTATDFVDNETITDAAGGSATANLAPTKVGPWYTGVVRYRVDWQASAGAIGYNWTASGQDRSKDSHAINGEWQTAVVHFPATGAASFFTMQG